MKRISVPFLLAALLCQLSLCALYAVGQTEYFDVKAPSTFLFTDKLVYAPGETQSLMMAQNGSLNPFPFENQFAGYFLYLENLQTGEKLYHPGYNPNGPITDIFNNPADPAGGHFILYRVPTATFTWFGSGGIFGGARPVPTTPGQYRWVMELRDTEGVYIQSRGFAPFNVVSAIETIPNEITTDTTLTNDKAYVMSGFVFVRPPATLTIQPGTVVLGDSATSGLVVTQGAKIHAVGTKRRPVVFTSAAPVGDREPGDWFGIAIAGYAPINIPGGVGQVEGVEGEVPYGGNDPDDNSGTMRYVRVEYAGAQFTTDSEANGLYLNGVGRGTVLEYLHFNQNQDDNIEFYGGTAQVKYVYCTGGGDDQFDWTEGFQGKAQFVITQVFADSFGNRGIEADNLSSDNDATPRSNPTIYNMTIIGPQQDYSQDEGNADHGLRLRRGTAGKLFNFIVMGYGLSAITVNDSATENQANAGNLDFDHSILWNNALFGDNGEGNASRPFGNEFTKNWLDVPTKKVFTDLDPRLVDPYNEITPDYSPGYKSPALRIDVVKVPPDDGFFEHVDFIGGMSPFYNWLEGGWAYVTPW